MKIPPNRILEQTFHFSNNTKTNLDALIGIQFQKQQTTLHFNLFLARLHLLSLRELEKSKNSIGFESLFPPSPARELVREII